jgi:large conductance mechanosensitive channel
MEEVVAIIKNKINDNGTMPIFKNINDFLYNQGIINSCTGFAISGAFVLFISALITGIFMPIFGILLNKYSFSTLKYNIKGNTFDIGAVLSSVITLVITVVIVYYAIFAPMNKLNAKLGQTLSTSKQCPYCITVINEQATKCPACTSSLV